MRTNYFLRQSTKKNILLILIIPIIIQLCLINLVKSISDLRLYYLIFLFFAILYLPYFYWLNVAVNFLYNCLIFFKLNLKKFKVSLLINVIVVFNFVFFIAYMFRSIFNRSEPNGSVFFLIALIQFIGIISFFYTSYFITKLILTVELKRKVCFNEIVGKLVVFSFPPIALWIIHNKIKKIQIKQGKSNSSPVPRTK